jgi:cell division protein FtsI/penicillin-binding protein 2/cell division protein FtsW (lipid II flippase)
LPACSLFMMTTTRSKEMERRFRHAEGLLLLTVALLVIGGAFSLFMAKSRSLPPATAVNINTANGQTLAQALEIPLTDAKRIVESRKQRGPFEDVDGLSRRKLAPFAKVSTAESGLVVRDNSSALRPFLYYCVGLLTFLFVAHFLVRKLQPRADPILLPIACLVAIFGVLLLFSLKDPVRDMPSYLAQAQGVIFGGLLALALGLWPRFHRLPLHRYGYAFALAAVVATLLLGVLGAGPGGVKLSIAGIQPVEGIKILLVFFLAAYLAERGALLDDPLRRIGPFAIPRPRDAGPLLVMYSLPLFLFALLKDLGPVLLLFGTFLILVYLATGRSGYILFGLAILLVGGFLGYILHFGVFQTRVDMWLSPWNNPRPRGDHLALGLWGLASGGPMGSGFGLGGTRFIPRGGSDLAYASLGEELGMLATVLVAGCFLAIALRGIGISRRSHTEFDRFLAAGLSCLLGLQAMLIICGTLGLLPLSGVTLPFLSYGKSSLLASFFMIGLLLALSSRATAAGNTTAAVIPPPPHYRAASARAGVFFFAFLGVAVPLRLLWVQGLGANIIASRQVRVPDADGIKRPHTNPRLLEIVRQIPRGQILDRNGRILAKTAPNGKRFYPYGAATGHMVGYLDHAVGGPVGFEDQFGPQLQGYTDRASLLPLWRMKDLPGFHLPRGQDVVTSIDAELQKSTLEALQKGMEGLRDHRTGQAKHRGAAVVLDVATGQVLAAVTLPTYDPSTLTPTILKALNTDLKNEIPLINRATRGYYPPGSTFKVAVASTLFATDKANFTYTCRHIDTNIIWDAPGGPYARRRIVDDEGDRPHGLTNLTEAISASCNIYFAHAALSEGPQTLRDQLARFGFAKMPTQKQFNAELPDIGYGQGPMLVTPLEMASVAQTVANGGTRQPPSFLKQGNTAKPTTILSANDASRLAEMMERVTRTGTAAGRFDGLPFSVAGKTGTAQNDRYDKVAHSWFIGFAPVNHPKVAFAVIVENGGYGAQVAAPIAREILRSVK